jgi:hypothetical protein
VLLCAIPQFAEPALADSTYTVGDKTFSYTELEKQPDGTQTDSITGPDGERGVIVKNNDGTVLLATDSEKHLIAGENCSDDRDNITDFKEITVRECRKDSGGEASWHKTVYLEYTCKKPPYYTRRIPLSVTEELSSENKPVPCTEEEFQSSGRAAAQFGANWDGVKAPPPGETPPPQQPPGQGGGGGKGDVPPWRKQI